MTAHIPHEVRRYHHDPHIESFGDEAVNQLAGVAGVDPEQIFKTLVVALPKNRLAVAVLPVPNQLSLKAASALRWDRVLCSAGKRGWDVAVHPQDLIRLTDAVTADIRAV